MKITVIYDGCHSLKFSSVLVVIPHPKPNPNPDHNPDPKTDPNLIPNPKSNPNPELKTKPNAFYNSNFCDGNWRDFQET